MPHGIGPSLLSTYLKGSTDGSDPFAASLSSRRPVIFEYRPLTVAYEDPAEGQPMPPPVKSVSAGPWTACAPGDGLSIDGDGTICVPGLRGASGLGSQTYKSIDPRRFDASGKIAAWQDQWFWLQPLRATVAIYHDRRVTGACAAAVVAVPGLAAYDGGGVDADSVAPVVRTMYLDSGNAARLEYRRDSWPDPESVQAANLDVVPTSTYVPPHAGPPYVDGYWTDDQPSVAAPDETLVDDSAWLAATARRKRQDLGRLDRGGTLELNGIVRGIALGTQIADMQGSPVRGVVTGIGYKFSRPQKTILRLT